MYSTLVGFSKCYESSFRLWLGPILVLMVRDAADLKIILNSEECFDKIDFIYKQLFTYGLLVMGGDEYKLHRKQINPLFYPMALRSYLPIINGKLKNFMARFDSGLKPNEEFELSILTGDFTMDTILATMFGVDHVDEKVRLGLIDSMEM